MPLRLAVSTIPSVFLLAVAISAMAAQAAESDNAEPSSSWGLGVGALSSQQPYTGIDRDNKAIPLIYFENEYLWVFGPNAEVKLSQLEIGDTQQIDFSLMGQYDFSGYDADDARVFDGMSDRKSSFWAGAKVEWHTGLVDVRAEWLSEVSGNSKGQRFNVGLERTWRVGEHITLTPQVTAMWQDKNTSIIILACATVRPASIVRPMMASLPSIPNLASGETTCSINTTPCSSISKRRASPVRSRTARW